MATPRPIFNLFTANSRSGKFITSANSYVCAPCLHRQQTRFLHRNIKALPVPAPTPFVPDVETFLTLIGRGLSQHASKFDSWNTLFTLTSPELKELGIEPARSRKYLLRWRQRFRNGDYGVGGDFKFVTDGVGELRVVEVPSLAEDNEQIQSKSPLATPGTTKLVLNVPAGETKYEALLDPGQSSDTLKKPKEYQLKNGYEITGPYAEAIRGTNGSGVLVKVREGMWEHRRGQKVFGGERRRAEVLHKMGVEEHRKNS